MELSREFFSKSFLMWISGELILRLLQREKKDANPEGSFPSAREIDDEVTEGREQDVLG